MVGSLLQKYGNHKKETTMFTNSEAIVGLWLVPVILCILVPLSMLCVWCVMQLSKKMSGKIEQVEKSVDKNRNESLVDTLQSQSTV